MKILLVEDDPFHMGYLEEQVASALPEADEILLAHDGAEGEELARRADVGAIVMDLQMKSRNGIEAARTIWKERPDTRSSGRIMRTKPICAASPGSFPRIVPMAMS